MFESGIVYWLKVKSADSDRIFSVKIKPLEENAFMVKCEVFHGEGNPNTIEIIPFTRILDVQKAK